MRKWIRQLAWKSVDKEFIKKVPLILDELKEEPLGMGKGQFLIDESFLFRVSDSIKIKYVILIKKTILQKKLSA